MPHFEHALLGNVAARFAAIYILLPLLLFVATWVWLPLGLPLTAAMTWGVLRLLPRGSEIGQLMSMEKSPSRIALHLGIVAIALAMVLMAYPNSGSMPDADYLKHWTILNDLVTSEWPVVYFEHSDVSHALRYSVGYYLLPAWIAKVLGAKAVAWTLAGWTFLGVVLIAEMTQALVRQARYGFLAATVFALFGGADLVVVLGGDANITELFVGEGPVAEAWARQSTVPLLAGSHPFELRWSPQHAMCAWIMAFLLLMSRHHPWFRSNLFPLAAAALLWSPFVAVSGSVIHIALTVLDSRERHQWRDYVSLANAFGIVTIALIGGYLSMDSAGVPSGLLWSEYDGAATRNLLTFVLVEFGILALLLVAAEHRRPASFWVPLALLLLLPFTFVGLANDLQMRGSQVPITMILIWALVTIRSRPASSPRFKFGSAMAAAVIAVGCLTGLQEAVRPDNFVRRLEPPPATPPMLAANFAGTTGELVDQYVAQIPNRGLAHSFAAEFNAAYQAGPAVDLLSKVGHHYGSATFDDETHTVSSSEPADAGFAFEPVPSTTGLFRTRAKISVSSRTSNPPGGLAAQLSSDGRPLAVFVGAAELDGFVVDRFSEAPIDGSLRLATGLGGWGSAEGWLRIDELVVTPLVRSPG